MRLAILLAVLPLLLAAAPAGAKGSCDDAQDQTTMNHCAADDYARADAELNRVYKQVMAGLDAHSQALLKNAQRDWIKWRDDECMYQNAQNEGGSIYPLVYNGCLTTLSMARTKQLQAGQN